MASSAYRELKSAVLMLRKHLLPRRFSPTGDYFPRVFTGVVSFRVLCHAAMEEYLENRTLEIALEASKAVVNGRVPYSAACLVSFSEHAFGSIPESLLPTNENQRKSWPERIDVKARVQRSARSHISYTRERNHGIREKNLLRLLLPIGVDVSAFDPVLVSELDNFGKLRGEFAHKSAFNHVISKPDPKSELDRVNNIVDLLACVDAEFEKTKRSLRS